MLALTKRTEYALIALCHLAREGSHVTSARDIAERHNVRLPLLMNVLKSLNQNGLLSSSRGSHGGYKLARAASAISLVDVLTAVEGPARLVSCAGPADAESRACELLGSCPVRAPILRVHQELEAFLARVTIHSLALDPRYGMVPDQDVRHGLPVLAAGSA